MQGYREAYRYGQYSYPVQEAAKGPFSSLLTEHQRQTAYQLGQMFGGGQATAAKNTAAKGKTEAAQNTPTPVGSWKKGRVSSAEGSISQMRKGFNSSQKEAFRMLTFGLTKVRQRNSWTQRLKWTRML